jgi:type IV pilus assembly protein PilO
MNFIDDLQNQDYSNLGGLPSWMKVGAVVLLMVVICAAGYFLKVHDQIVKLSKEEAKEQSKKTEYKVLQRKASQLPAYVAQLEEMEVILNSMLKQLPSKNQMQDIIVDVSQTALASGIDNELFKPGTEILKDFYAEKPISLRMIGKYHQFGEFVSGVASLPRVVILTMHDISLKPVKKGGGFDGILLLEGTARTYRYLDDEEQAMKDEQSSKKKKKRRK